MFDQLVAPSLTFLHEANELEAYLADHFAAYDAERGQASLASIDSR